MADIRTLRPGEFIQNDDGTRSTERSITITSPLINDGRPTNIPTIFVDRGKITALDAVPGLKEGSQELEDAAIDMALRSRQNFPAFGSIKEAVASAVARSEGGGAFQGNISKGMGPSGSTFQ